MTTTLIGRDDEIVAIKDLLGRARLVTLTGVGGVGKTRLALQVADEVGAEFRDGVRLTELTSLDDPDLLPHLVSAALGVQDQTDRSQVDVITAFLSDKEMLLVLDTCEHLLPAVRTLASVLLQAAPELRIMATSRVVLGIAGEHIHTVEPLSTVGPEIADIPAAMLFVDRGRAIIPDLTAGPEVVRLCRRLEGIPLAIEIAAVRLRGLTVPELMSRLNDRFAVLEGTGEEGPARHQTMRTAIGWSHELCEPAERLLWARLSVFPGTFDPMAVAAICSDDRLAAADAETVLAGLVEKSIVILTGGRYRMLDTVREYGSEWLERLDETHMMRQRHRDFYRDLAAAFDRDWHGPEQALWLRRLREELPDIRAALEFSYTHGGEEGAGLELAGLLASFWATGGPTKEGRHFLERGLTLCPDPHPRRVRALWACGWAALVQGQTDAATEHLTECRALAAEEHLEGDLAGAVGMLGFAAQMRGDLAGAVWLAREAIDALTALDDPRDLIFRNCLATALIAGGRLEETIEVLNQALARCDHFGERWLRSHAEHILGSAELAQSNIEGAASHVRHAASEKGALDDTFGLALAIDVLAQVAAAGGDGDRGARLLGIADRLWRTFGIPQMGLPVFLEPRRRCEAGIRGLIGDDAYTVAFTQGQGLSPEDGVGYALTT